MKFLTQTILKEGVGEPIINVGMKVTQSIFDLINVLIVKMHPVTNMLNIWGFIVKYGIYCIK